MLFWFTRWSVNRLFLQAVYLLVGKRNRHHVTACGIDGQRLLFVSLSDTRREVHKLIQSIRHCAFLCVYQNILRFLGVYEMQEAPRADPFITSPFIKRKLCAGLFPFGLAYYIK